MYLKEHFIRFLKIKNVLFLIIGIFLASMSVAIIIELIVYYFGDWYTILTARSMPESVLDRELFGVISPVTSFLR